MLNFRVIVIVVVALFATAVWTLLGSWVVVSHRAFPRMIQPGGTYQVKDRVYRLPNWPARSIREGSTRASLTRNIPILSEDFLNAQRTLLQRSIALLTSQKVTHWISGGTLIGFSQVFQTFLPWDDDIDIHTKYEHKPHLFGQAFTQAAAQHGLDVIQLMGQSEQHAEREGAAVRLRVRGTTMPVCDIFFESPMPNQPNTWGKIDAWHKHTLTFNKKEQWPAEYLWPLQWKWVDGLKLPFPAQPNALLKKQYNFVSGKELLFTPPMESHQFPYQVLGPFWRTRKA